MLSSSDKLKMLFKETKNLATKHLPIMWK